MKNVLVQYQGGGYDGCIWERNFFFLDKDGQFQDVFSSGHCGITTADQAAFFLKSADKDTYYIYDLTNEKAIDEFCKETAEPLVLGILKWFEQNPQDEIELYVRCTECGCKITNSSEDGFLEDWHGCGGIMSTADVLLCHDCLALGTCDCCNEYIGEADIVVLDQVEPESDLARQNEYIIPAARQLIDDGCGRICSYCLHSQADELQKDVQEQIRQQAFATGKPDIFSDEMRWFWGA